MCVRVFGGLIDKVQKFVLRVVAELGEEHVGQRGAVVKNDHNLVFLFRDSAVENLVLFEDIIFARGHLSEIIYERGHV